MTRDEILSIFKKEGRIHFEELINEKANFEKDFDPKAFKYFLKLSGISPTIKRETLLQNLDCLSHDKKLTNLGVLFFSKDIDFIMNYALVDCVLFRGTDKVKILDRKQYKGNIIENIESALAFVQRHTNTEYVITTNTEYVITGRPRREEIPDYPETALRETIVNAVCHRDYFDRRCHVVVEVFADRVEIYNPGGLPGGLDPKKFGTKSVPRNLLIASMLHRANYIERAGTGIGRIKSALAKHKKKIDLKIDFSDKSVFYNVIFRKKRLVETGQKRLVETTQKGMERTPQKRLVETTQKGMEGTPQKRLMEATQKGLEGTTQKRLEGTTQKRLEGTTQKRLEGTPQKRLEGTTQKRLEGTTQKRLMEATQKGLEGTTQKGLEGTTQKGLEGTTQKRLEGTTQKRLMEATQKGLEGTTQKGLEGTTQKRLMEAPRKGMEGTAWKVLSLINKKPYITRQKLSEQIGNISPDGIKYHLEQLKKQGFIKRIGPDKGGYWKVLKK